MMLFNAIAKMIYNCEALFFYNSSNSVCPTDVISKTLSPWIYSEIAMTNLVKKRDPKEHRTMSKSLSEGRENFSAQPLKIEYNLNLSQFESIDADKLNQWAEESFKSKHDALDYLYESRII